MTETPKKTETETVMKRIQKSLESVLYEAKRWGDLCRYECTLIGKTLIVTKYISYEQKDTSVFMVRITFMSSRSCYSLQTQISLELIF